MKGGISMKYRIFNIDWDVEDGVSDLPMEFEIEIDEDVENIEDELADAISDEYGYCHYCFDYERVD